MQLDFGPNHTCNSGSVFINNSIDVCVFQEYFLYFKYHVAVLNLNMWVESIFQKYLVMGNVHKHYW